MHRPFRRLALLIALLSFEGGVLAAHERCVMTVEGPVPAALTDCAHESAPDGSSPSEHAPSPRHGAPSCAAAAACAALALPALASSVQHLRSSARTVGGAVPTLAPGARPAPDVPPPRA